MKIFFTLIAVTLLSISLVTAQEDFAARKNSFQSKLSISTMSNEQVKVIVDGDRYNMDSNDETMIDNIQPGYHTIKVFQQGKRYNNAKWSNKSMQLIYQANLYIKPQYHVDVLINRFGKAFIDEKQINNNYYAGNDDENDHGDWVNIGLPGMSDDSFEEFKETLQNEPFDNTRLTMAKQTISKNSFSSAQIKDIVQLFSFDNSRLDIARYSYKNTMDKNNYYIINDAFAFSSTKEELVKYIDAQQ